MPPPACLTLLPRLLPVLHLLPALQTEIVSVSEKAAFGRLFYFAFHGCNRTRGQPSQAIFAWGGPQMRRVTIADQRLMAAVLTSNPQPAS
jgi:hypothetical protein